jgi:transposase
VTGVGALTALAFAACLEDPARFRRSRTVGADLGLRPRQRQSGERDPQLGITKAGDEQLRRLLVSAAHYILGPFGPDCDLRRFGLRLVARGGAGAKPRAVVAVARKLAGLADHRSLLCARIEGREGVAARRSPRLPRRGPRGFSRRARCDPR